MHTFTPQSVLVSRFSALGDVAMTIPVLYSACAANPNTDFIFITKPVAAKLFMETPANLTVIGVDTDEYKGVGGMWRLARILKKRYRIDSYADLHDVLRTRLLRIFLRISGVRVHRIRKGRRGKYALTRRRNKVMIPLISTRARYREVFFSLGLSYTETFRGYFQGNTPVPALYAVATPEKAPGEHWIAIAPFAKHKGKIYPEELMERVVKALAAKKGYKLFLLGAGQRETNIIARWCLGTDNVINMAALGLGFQAEMALMHQCEAVLAMDSANMHIASLVGVRVVSIWGATHPYCGFMGWHQKKEDAIGLDLTCRPCSVFGNKPCHRGDFLCMYGITPDRILSTLLR